MLYKATEHRFLNDPIAHALVMSKATAQQAADVYAAECDRLRAALKQAIENQSPIIEMDGKRYQVKP